MVMFPETAGMGMLLVATFEDEAGANAGACVLRKLHARGVLTLYASAIVARRAKGGGLEIRTPIAKGDGVSAPAVGAAVGALVSLLGGPVTAAARTTPAGLVGPICDLAEAGLDAEFLEQLSRQLRPSRGAVVAQVEEERQLPIDTFIASMGGRVFRHRLAGSLVEERLVAEVVALRKDLIKVRAEGGDMEHITAARAVLRTRSADLKRALERARAMAETLRREGAAKVSVLRAQAAMLKGEARTAVEDRAAGVRARLEARAARLDRAVESGAPATPDAVGSGKRLRARDDHS
jgi:uncharacterized membrane protein